MDIAYGYRLLEAAGRKRASDPGGEVDTSASAKILLDEFRAGKLGRFTLDGCRNKLKQGLLRMGPRNFSPDIPDRCWVPAYLLLLLVAAAQAYTHLRGPVAGLSPYETVKRSAGLG